MSNENSALQRLLERIQNGDDEASAEIYSEYAPYLQMVVRRHMSRELQSKFDSVDVVQSVWADLLDGLRRGRWSFESPAHLRAFLVRSTRNRLVDYVRRLEKTVANQTDVSDEQTIPGKSARPSAEARANEKWQKILGHCSPEHKQIVELRKDGHSINEIAEKTGYHPSSVRRILYELDAEVGDG